MITFYLVRHGQKEAVPFDPPLTKIGVKQAEATARRFNNLQLRTIISSQKLRTRQTAGIIAKQQSVTIDKRVQERLEWEHNQSFKEFMTEWNKTDIDRRYKPKKGNSSHDNGKQMKKIIDEFNEIFNNDAHISIKDSCLEITIGTKSMEIEYPRISGVKSTAPLSTS